MAWPEPVTLEGEHVRLVPLSPAHEAELVAAVRDGELWQLWYTSIPAPEQMGAEIARRLALREAGAWLPFAAIDPANGRAFGMTNYLNIDAANQRVEIGATWYARAQQRSPRNTEAKLLLLTHAFEALDCIAVEFRTHFFNQQSRRAIERLGAKLDGILRSHQRLPNGSLRDTCVYSIIASEWPAVKTHLAFQLTRPRPEA
jgi:RimJ/RimL family protein N-acetyltransferase